MSMLFYKQGYKKLAQLIFEWQDADRAALLSMLIVVEISLHWLWCWTLWLNRAKLADYVHLELLPLLWIFVTAVGIFFLWLSYFFRHAVHSSAQIFNLQWLLTIVYSSYIASITFFIGYSSLMAGVSLVGGAMLAMLLMNRRMVWYAFISYVVFIIILTVLPYYGIVLPGMRKLPMHPLYVEGVSTFFPHFQEANPHVPVIHAHLVEVRDGASIAADNLDIQSKTMQISKVLMLQRENVLFWRLSYLYFSLPKAIIIVQLIRTLLSIIERNKRSIQYNAEHDALTGLKNRRASLSWLRQSLFEGPKVKKARQDFSVIMIDLDTFKSINDSYGHHAGDLVLKAMAKLLEQALVRPHLVSRYGGEEFLVALPQTSQESALVIAEALRREVASNRVKVCDDKTIEITASMGVATLTETEVLRLRKHYRQLLAKDKEDTFKSYQLTQRVIQDLIELADSALYEAKRQGRNRVESANAMIVAQQLNKPDFQLD